MPSNVKHTGPAWSAGATAALISMPLWSALVAGCDAEAQPRKMTVTATAYNSVRAQTDAQPAIAAWGDRLKPGMKAIAVSRDLLAEGLTRGVLVKIEGLDGQYKVLDKTAKRFSRRIDIYMGKDVRKAREFGVRKVSISWLPSPAD